LLVPRIAQPFRKPWARTQPLRDFVGAVPVFAGTHLERALGMAKLNRILVPVDFSACSQAALDYAAFLAQLTAASVDVLHVWEPPLFPSDRSAIYGANERKQKLVEFMATIAGHEMERVLGELEPKLGERVRGRIESGRPVSAILSVLADGAYDLVVMGTHGRRGISRMTMGSVAEQIVRRARCPVVTVRAGAVALEQAGLRAPSVRAGSTTRA